MRNNALRLLVGICVLLAPIASYASEMDARTLAREHHTKGKQYLAEGKYAEAQKEFDQALEIYRNSEKPSTTPDASVIDTPKTPILPAAQAIIIEASSVIPEPTPSVPSKKAVIKKEKSIKKVTKPAKEEIVAAIPVELPASKLPDITSPKKSFEYRITADDILQVSVWQNPDLTQEVIVRPDGKISFPLVGDVQASGITIPQLSQEMTEKLKEYIRNPQVFVSIRKFGGKKVIVLGEVGMQGVYYIEGTSSVLEAIAKAQGFSTHAVASSVILIRGGLSNPNAQRLNLTKALDQGDVRENVMLEPEDIVFVPKKFIANLNYFLTQLLEPLRTSGAVATEAAKWYYGAYAPDYIKNSIQQAANATVVLK